MANDLPGKIVKRRELVAEKCEFVRTRGDLNIGQPFINSTDRKGIAFSGGGIRSATISLGLTEALAAYDRFYAFDMMSTVSGGGYFGSFLRSLYVEREAGNGKTENEKVIKSRTRLADKVLRSLPDQQYFRGEKGRSDDVVKKDQIVKNPLWWLRENGRYLAPNGMSDYAFALAFIIRNWLALLFAFMIPLMLLFAALQFGMIAARNIAGWQEWMVIAGSFKAPQFGPLVSPAVFWLPSLLAMVLGVGAGYWVSTRMPEQQDNSFNTRFRFLAHWSVVAIILAMPLVAVCFLLPADALTPQGRWTSYAFVGALLLSSSHPFLGMVWPMSSWNILRDFRRTQTRLLAYVGSAWLIVAGFALVDTMAIWLRDYSNDDATFTFALPATVTALLAWLSAKVPQWLESKNGGVAGFLKSYGKAAAMVAAIIMLAGAALIADMLVLKLIWSGASWNAAPDYNWLIIGISIAFLALLFFAIRSAPKFLNITGLGQFYASRLSRSYLGATNYNRLKTNQTTDVTRSELGDDMGLRHYLTKDVIAPLHLINVTLNRTIGHHEDKPKVSRKDDPLIPGGAVHSGRLPSYESSIVLRDRQGDRMVFGPYGMRTGGHFWTWDDLDKAGAGELTLGTACAISGAAVNSGMGRQTSIGRSILLTLANLRLGYWWKSPIKEEGIWNFITGTYDYFFCEMLARFNRQKGYWHLSDGGHSENSAALSLLERGCNFILISDNGEDPDYQFADLEIFVRTARTDIGVEVDVVAEDKFPANLNLDKNHFFNGTAEDWRKQAKAKDSGGFALLLKVTSIPPTDVESRASPDHLAWIVWLKPSLFKALPADLSTYAELHPDFPQQPTSNQFFDEAQWESYRRLGFHMGRTLFASTDTLAQFLPKIALKPLS